jgi:glucose-1-phosphatase
MPVSAIVFDFGNVVAWFSHQRSAEQLAAFTDFSADQIFDRLYSGPLHIDYELGRCDSAQFLATLRRELRLTGTDEQLAHAYANIFDVNPAVCELLPLLAGRYRLLLLSNTNDLHYRHFAEQFRDPLRHFDDLILSHRVGARKPDAALYEYCEQRAGVSANEILFIDDLPANVDAARARGWRGIVYRPEDDLSAALGLDTDERARREERIA